jgi:hypothetical protein
MAGKNFLNPLLKVILCSIGIFSMAYYLLPVLQSDKSIETLDGIRVLVLLGFGYLLIQSLRHLIKGSS